MNDKFRELINIGVSAYCKRHMLQICHMCEREECCDNTNPLVKKIKMLESRTSKELEEAEKPAEDNKKIPSISKSPCIDCYCKQQLHPFLFSVQP